MVPAILWWLLGGLVQIAGTLVGKVLISLGIAYVTYAGVDTALTYAKTQFVAQLGGIPVMAVQVAGLAKVGVCLSMLISALSARLLMQGLTSGTMKRMIVK